MKIKRKRRREVTAAALKQGRLKLLLSLSKLNEVSKHERNKIQVKLALAGKQFNW